MTLRTCPARGWASDLRNVAPSCAQTRVLGYKDAFHIFTPDFFPFSETVHGTGDQVCVGCGKQWRLAKLGKAWKCQWF